MATNKVPSTTARARVLQRQRASSDRGRFFAASDDNGSTVVEQIQATHNPDGQGRVHVDVNAILGGIEGILRRVVPDVYAVLNGKDKQLDLREEKANTAAFQSMIEPLAFTIHKISCELSRKCSGEGDAHGTTMTILSMLSTYSWDAKVLLALAAFAVNYREFFLITQHRTRNSLADPIALLRHVVNARDQDSSSLKSSFDALNTLIAAILDVTKCIVRFRELPTQYISDATPPLSVALTYIPTAAYWTIRSTVTCASQIASCIDLGHENMPSTVEAWELAALAHKVNSIDDHLKKQMELCYRHIDEKRCLEAFQMLVCLFKTSHVDNMEVLKQLINPKDDIPPLLDCTTKTRVSIDVLRKKTVLLLISDLDISNDDIALLDHVYRDAKTKPEIQYEMVWLPVVDNVLISLEWDRMHQEKFKELQSKMSWLSIHHPSLIEPPVIKYIKEVWNFLKRLILVALDPLGKVVSTNVLHMTRIWMNLAFPFTKEREDTLWKSESWRLELVIGGLDMNIIAWMVEGKYICLYGGEDMEWIRKFTVGARNMAKTARIQLELCYVGKSNAKERVRRNRTTIMSENLSYCFGDLTIFWSFWARLESMLYSKLQRGMTAENDAIIQEALTILSYDGSDEGWAIFFRSGSGTRTTPTPEMVRGRGDYLIETVTGYDEWKDKAEAEGFLPAMQHHLADIQTPKHCNRLILPGINSNNIPEIIVCAECGRVMEECMKSK